MDCSANLMSAGEAGSSGPSQGINVSEIKMLNKDMLKYSVCRICATYHATHSLVRLFEQSTEHSYSESLADVVNRLLPIKVKDGDQLPEVVCTLCVEKLLEWKKMVEESLESARILQLQANLLNDSTLENTNDKSWDFSETVKNVLTSYCGGLDNVELVCQECEFKAPEEECFIEHLAARHQLMSDRDAVEAFVRDHVTFEQTLISDTEMEIRDAYSWNEVASTKPSTLECPICTSCFTSSSRLSYHMRTHRELVECGGVTFHKTALLQYLKEIVNETDFQCRYCLFEGADGISLVAHVRRNHPQYLSQPRPRLKRPPATGDETNQKKIPAVCPECNLTFSNKYNMLVHMKRHTEPATTYECECGRGYATLGNLMAHRRVAHDGVLSHACAECGDAFPTRTARDVHARVHTGARPYACSVCARTFRAANSRDTHQETHAPPRHRCRLCDKLFRRKAHLKHHVRTHRKR